MADDKVTLVVDLDAKDALAALDLFGKEAAKVVQKTEKNVSGISGAFKSLGLNAVSGLLPAVTAAGAAAAAFKFLTAGIADAAAEAKRIKQIEASLRATGEASEVAVQDVVDFANELKRTTAISDDLAQETFILAKSFGINADQAKDLTRAAVELSKATGVDVETAARQLGGTLDGTIGKVGNLGERFRNLTTEQLKNGDAIRLVNELYGGTAAKSLDTYEGAISRLSNAFGDLTKVSGNAVISNSAVVSSIGAAATVLEDITSVLTTGIAVNQKAIKETARQTIEEIENVGKTSSEVNKNLLSVLENSEKAISTESVNTFAERLSQFTDKVVVDSRLTGKALEEARKKYEELAKSVENAGLSEIEIARKATKIKLEELQKYADGSVATEQEIAKTRLLIEKDLNAKLEKERKDSLEKRQKIEDDIFKEQLETDKLIKQELKQQADDAEKQAKDSAENQAKTVSRIGSLISSATKGKAGAVDTVSGAAGFAADIFLPGSGAAVQEITKFLATASKEEIKATVKGFADAIPEVIKAIAENFPVLIEAIVGAIGDPKFVIALADALLVAFERLTVGLVDGILKGIGTALGPTFKPLLGPLSSLRDAFLSFGNEVKSFFQGFADAVKSLVDVINQLFQPIEDLIAALKGGKGGGKGVIGEFFGEIGKGIDRAGGSAITQGFAQAEDLGRSVIGLAKGGIVPRYYADGGFVSRGTDTVPAMLTPGELVAPVDLTKRLDEYINPEEKAAEQAMLSAIYAQVMAPIVVKAEAKVNQSAFADIILQLNRQNARLAG